MDHQKSKRVPEKPVLLLYWLSQSLYVNHNKLWKILHEMEIPDHLTCLWRNLYADQEAKVRTEHGTTVQFSHSVVSDSLRPHGLQHNRLPWPSPTSEAYTNSCPSSQWCHPTISSSVIPFSSCLQSFPASGAFPMSQLFTSHGQLLEFQLQHQSFQWRFRIGIL